MDSVEIKEAETRPLRPDARREVTDAAYKTIVNAELTARLEKTRRLQQARMAVSATIRQSGERS